jgi:hypothetical protein
MQSAQVWLEKSKGSEHDCLLKGHRMALGLPVPPTRFSPARTQEMEIENSKLKETIREYREEFADVRNQGTMLYLRASFQSSNTVLGTGPPAPTSSRLFLTCCHLHRGDH